MNGMISRENVRAAINGRPFFTKAASYAFHLLTLSFI